MACSLWENVRTVINIYYTEYIQNGELYTIESHMIKRHKHNITHAWPLILHYTHKTTTRMDRCGSRKNPWALPPPEQQPARPHPRRAWGAPTPRRRWTWKTQREHGRDWRIGSAPCRRWWRSTRRIGRIALPGGEGLEHWSAGWGPRVHHHLLLLRLRQARLHGYTDTDTVVRQLWKIMIHPYGKYIYNFINKYYEDNV
jgi:hypothetical protein